MKIGQKFNKLSLEEYYFYIDNHSKYTDFNTLGLYRSILENQKLDTHDQIALREYANRTFAKFFNFLQIKDPSTYIKLITLGKDLTVADECQLWKDIWINQDKILTAKSIKHRSFGVYSKHSCGYDDCPLNGIMIHQGSPFTQMEMRGKNYNLKLKAEQYKSDRKRKKEIIRRILET